MIPPIKKQSLGLLSEFSWGEKELCREKYQKLNLSFCDPDTKKNHLYISFIFLNPIFHGVSDSVAPEAPLGIVEGVISDPCCYKKIVQRYI